MSVLRIGATIETLADMPEPAHGGMKVTLQDIDAAGAGRSANGTMIRDRVCGGATAKRKIELEWPPLTTEDISTLMQAISGTYFWVEYLDPYVGELRTAEFYAGDRTAPVYWIIDGKALWQSLSFNLIEK